MPVIVKDRVLVGVFQGPRAGENAELFLAKTFRTFDQLRENQLQPVREAVEAFAAPEVDLDRIAAAVEGLRLSA